MLLPPLPMQGGYKAFWKAFPDVCEGGYVPMDHPQYTEQLKVGGWVGGARGGGGSWARNSAMGSLRALGSLQALAYVLP
jgi:hypothetical protein